MDGVEILPGQNARVPGERPDQQVLNSIAIQVSRLSKRPTEFCGCCLPFGCCDHAAVLPGVDGDTSLLMAGGTDSEIPHSFAIEISHRQKCGPEGVPVAGTSGRRQAVDRAPVTTRMNGNVSWCPWKPVH